MIESSVLTIFIPTFFFVSVTPGMCMTLALTMGMTIGVITIQKSGLFPKYY